MNSENFPIKTFDNIRHSKAGINGYPANDFKCHCSWHPCEDSWLRVYGRVAETVEELYRVDIPHHEIRYALARILRNRMFPANAYVYDACSMDVKSLKEERDFLNQLIHQLSLIRDAREKALERDRLLRVAAQEQLKEKHEVSSYDANGS